MVCKGNRKDRLHRSEYLKSLDERVVALLKGKQFRYGSATKIRNRCIETGRGRGLVGQFGLSRHEVHARYRELGLTKASW